MKTTTIIILLLVSRQLFAQVECKTEQFKNIDSAFAHKACVKSLDLKTFSKDHFLLPRKILAFKNLENLDIGGKVRIYKEAYPPSLPTVIFFKSRLLKIPKWLCQFDSLKEINLIGNPRLNRNHQIQKLKRIKHLEILHYFPDKINKRTLKAFKNLTSLKTLHIHDNYVIKLSDVEKLQKVLPNCKIEYFYRIDDLNKNK